MNIPSPFLYLLTLSSTLFCLSSTAGSADALKHLKTFDWTTPSIEGLSGLEVSNDGQSFSAISDRGWFLSGTLNRTNNLITSVDLHTYVPILGNDGLPAAARRTGDWSDSEGLAIAPDGTIWISFERWARVAKYDSPMSVGQWIQDHPAFSDFADNRQLEALALSPNGVLYTIPENPSAKGFPIYRLDTDGWVIEGHIPQKNRFSITGADFDQSGNLYLLERKLVLGLWWQSRIRRVQPHNWEIDDILWASRRGEFYNLEGIAVWNAPEGLRLTLISDDNGDSNEPTQIVEFSIGK